MDHGLSVDDPTEVLKTGIKGTIVFNFTDRWPDTIAETRLVALENFPPDPADTLLFSDPIQSGIDSLDYQLSLAPATYQIIAVIFREKEKPWDVANILAVHAPLDACTIIPDLSQAVTVTSNSPIVENVDIEVDLTKGSISGEVQFVGDWSPEITFAGIIALRHPLDLSNLIPCGLAVLPVKVERANYKVLVPENNYTILVVVGKDLADVTNLADISIIGFYHANDDTTNAAPVQVAKNQDIRNIDITANLSTFNQND
ncbi:MAG: hypothetical protein ACE5HO_12690 [bacterium]